VAPNPGSPPPRCVLLPLSERFPSTSWDAYRVFTSPVSVCWLRTPLLVRCTLPFHAQNPPLGGSVGPFCKLHPPKASQEKRSWLGRTPPKRATRLGLGCPPSVSAIIQGITPLFGTPAVPLRTHTVVECKHLTVPLVFHPGPLMAPVCTSFDFSPHGQLRFPFDHVAVFGRFFTFLFSYIFYVFFIFNPCLIFRFSPHPRHHVAFFSLASVAWPLDFFPPL